MSHNSKLFGMHGNYGSVSKEVGIDYMSDEDKADWIERFKRANHGTIIVLWWSMGEHCNWHQPFMMYGGLWRGLGAGPKRYSEQILHRDSPVVKLDLIHWDEIYVRKEEE